ncbi:MAG: DUF4296 domain-containing protein [Polaribacter sp.]|uniref:DUF4296 domain-containing protein n=1 Tax=Polaribacter sp. TaxID=1920175 RepID=UPI002F355EB2
MKKLLYIFIFTFLVSCTSNTIFEKPKNLIPKDTMSLLIQDLMIASTAKYVKTKKLEKNINYMPFVYDKFKIDSTRFFESNAYYVSKVDIYEAILTEAKNSLDKRKEKVTKLKSYLDSIGRDSIKKSKITLKALDTIEEPEAN